ncbi:MAG: protein kinase [Polyangiaceae bacterium]
MAIHPGDILAGYRVTRLLGRGGMGEVWGAVDDRTGRDVALKVLLQRAAMKPDLVKRFEREAKITSAIKSPFVCQLYEVTQTDEGAHLLVFEQLAGESLSDRLKRETYLPLGEVGIIIDDVLNGLVAAHAAGVIHRDLKPGNIFLERVNDPKRPERAKILDFGISKITGHGEKEPTLTAFDATLGSFAYMAPEQIRGAARADERADIYAVGAVAFRALAGRLPFEGTSAAVLVSLKLDRSAPTLEVATGEKWPAGVERFLEKALARQREQRFASASEALEAWRASQPGNITKVKLPPSHPPSRKGDAPPSQRPPSQRAPSQRAPMPPTSQRAMPPTSQRAVAEPPEASPIVPAFPEDMPTEVDDHPPTMDGWAEPQRAHPPRTKDTRENTGRSTRISRAGRKQGGR